MALDRFARSLPDPPLAANGRSVAYLAAAGSSASIWLGTSGFATTAVLDRLSPMLYGVAAGLCVAAAIRRSNVSSWFMSGLFLTAAHLVRAVAVAKYGSLGVHGPDIVLFLVMGLYPFAALGTVGAWLGWLRPISVDDEGLIRWKD